MQRWFKLFFKALLSLIIQLAKGKYGIYFLPGIAISAVFLGLGQEIALYWRYAEWISEIPFIGSYFSIASELISKLIDGIYLFLFHFLAVSCLSPLHTVFSAQIAEDMKVTPIGFSWDRVVNDLVRTIGVVVLGGLYYLLLKMIWLLISNNANLGGIDYAISYLLISFFIGYNAFDYSMERNNTSVLQSWRFSYIKFPYVMIVGVIFSFSLMIPHIGFAVAPIIGTYLATYYYVKLAKN